MSSFSCGLVLSERFSAQTSHLCSAPPLGCGTSRRFERLVWASLHLTERSGTIEVHLATLSAQICTKSLTQSYMVLSIESIFVQQIKFGICGKDPLKTAVYCPHASDRASGVRTSRQKTTAFFAVVCLSVRSSFDDEILRRDESRPRSSIPFRRCSLPACHRTKPKSDRATGR